MGRDADEMVWAATERLREALGRVDMPQTTVEVRVDDLTRLLETAWLVVPPQYEDDELVIMRWLNYIVDRHTFEDTRPRILAWLNARWGDTADAQPRPV